MSSSPENPQPHAATGTRDVGAFGGMSPSSILDKATGTDPSFKLLWVILGIVVVVSIAAATVNLAFLAFGALIVVALLCILPVCMVIYKSAQPNADTQVSPAGRQLQSIAFFIAWSSAVLVVITLVALLSSALIDWPAPIRSSIWPVQPVIAKERGDLDKIDFAKVTQLNGDELNVAKTSIKAKGVQDYRIRALFVEDWMPSTGVLLESDDNVVRIFIVVGPLSRPFLWCTVHEKDSDYETIHKLIGPTN